jgi:hypothetical protein
MGYYAIVKTKPGEELSHWKYIKKKKLPDGTYKYYYKQSELDRMKSDIDKNNEKELKYIVGATNAESDKNIAAERMDEYAALYQKTGDYKYLDAYSISKSEYESNKDEENAYRNQAKRTEEKGRKMVERYKAKKVKTFVERTISKGIVAVANFISKLSRKLNKKKRKETFEKNVKKSMDTGKKFLQKLFGKK